LDAQMPDMDGVSLALELSVLPRTEQSHIIMLSSMSRHFDANMLKRIGIAHYLHKPIAQRELHQTIASVLEPAPLPILTSSLAAPPITAQVRLRILLAEDNLVNQKVARRLLERLGHQCEVVDNGREALERWREQPWDVLLIDLQMPEMDGETAIRLLREETLVQGRSHQPAIAMTAHAMQGDKERCLAMGFDGYIAKPVNQDALQNEIMRVAAGEQQGLPDEASLLKQCADDPQLVQELLALFGEGLDEAMLTIEQAIDNNNRDALRRVAHKLRGEAVTLCFTALAERLQQLESEAASLDQDGLNVLRGELIEEVGRSVAWLRQRAQEVKHDP
ncbi:MAG TPA: hybrid sensor histidine kinase/response regulator, partial [Enterobacteriaceae bacterium]|nr:hybrid sensor histidine kinase/response regulator [Enterobacteriaceae bacterium]